MQPVFLAARPVLLLGFWLRRVDTYHTPSGPRTPRRHPSILSWLPTTLPQGCAPQNARIPCMRGFAQSTPTTKCALRAGGCPYLYGPTECNQ
ncbi:hypothetical protein DL96DRAFT_1283901 [Flagelloscypha sp. PMI_526]|nr:hypothetical protein DL96DRAFT_1283901 [Flagelloscypha sp. PMI_526]